MPATLFLNEEEVKAGWEGQPRDGAFFVDIQFRHRMEVDSLKVHFN